MNLRWLWFDYVPPWAPLTGSQRRAVRRRITAARRGSHVDPWLRLAVSIPLIASYSCLCAMLYYLAPRQFIGMRLGPAVRCGLAAACCWIIAAILAQWFFGRRVARTLRELDFKVCAACGYDLRGSDEPGRCPECGSSVDAPAAAINRHSQP
jgi:hypothetical protein